MNHASSSNALQVSLRECRLVFERLMQVARVDAGLVPALRDCALFSAAIGSDGFAGLPCHLELLARDETANLRLDDSGAEPRVDCDGQHAWLVADTLLDLLADEYKRHGKASLVVENVGEEQELRIIPALAERYALRVEIATRDGAWALSAHPLPAGGTPLLQRIRCEGLSVPSALWWQLFHHANQALAPDSFESRRHAGSIMVNTDGRLVGRPDEDETDLSLLVAGIQSGTTAPTH